MKSIALACCFCAAAIPAAAQIVRVSVSTAGVEANGGSFWPSVSADGRFVAFASAASNLVTGDTNNFADIFVRDRDTDTDGVFDEPGAVATTRISLGAGGVEANAGSSVPVITPDGRYVVYVSQATNLVAVNNPSAFFQVYRFDRQTSTTIRVSANAPGDAAQASAEWPAVSDDGNVVAFISSSSGGLVPGAAEGTHVYVRNITQSLTTIAPEPADWAALPAQQRFVERVAISGDGSRVAYIAFVRQTLTQFLEPGIHTAVVADLASGAITPVPSGGQFFALSASGASTVIGTTSIWFPTAGTIQRRVIATGAATPALPLPQGLLFATASPSARYALTANARLHDFDLGLSTPLGVGSNTADFSANDRWLAVESGSTTLVAGDTNDAVDIFVIDLPDLLDADDDTMDDRWETIFGVTDPSADPDTDGQTNAQEEDAGTHPNGQVRRFLAEGATGTFFHTTIGLANPNPSLAAAAVLTFDKGDGTRVRRAVSVPAGRSVAVDVGAVSGLEATDVSTTVESDRFLGVERGMTWGGADLNSRYGSHAETAAAAPSTTWFLAEGSTVLDFDLFYLLQNPQATTTQATIRFLLPSGTTVTRTYDLAPGSRTTIYVNQIAGLAETDVSGDITATAPIVVERAMYRSVPNQPFGLGHGAMGVTAPATSWFLAEGATGTFFDLYVLIANPSSTDATVQARYARPDGSVVTQTYSVRANSRFSVFVDSIPGLEATSVATTVTSTNAVPIVAERAMYWPGGFFDYYEGHASPGTTTTALNWIVGGAEGGGENAAQTFVLIANTASAVGEATITLLPDAGFTGTVPAPVTVALPATSRTTVPITALTGTFGVLVTSSGGSPVPLVVESAVYRSVGGVTWAAGSNALATPVP